MRVMPLMLSNSHFDHGGGGASGMTACMDEVAWMGCG
jgi:hypothetical protein